jgi:membrane-bound lytic murein transglycosylase B
MHSDRVAATPAARTVVAWRAVAGRIALATQALALACGGMWLLSATMPAPHQDASTVDSPAAGVSPALVEPGSVLPADPDAGTVLPVRLPQSSAGTGPPLTAWSSTVASATGIPARALLAYGSAELNLRANTPGCRVSWTTLAGIGRIESNHGQFAGARLTEDGRPSTPIVGVPLDGSAGVRRIGDTDGGTYDGDPTLDRAVGPMQFIPSTWRRWAADGNGDGRADPQQIDDAALAAARYLCAGGRDMGSAKGWWAGVLSYNNSVPYGQKVFGLADKYAKAAMYR